MQEKETWKIVRDDIVPREEKEIIQDIKTLLEDDSLNYLLVGFYNLIVSTYGK